MPSSVKIVIVIAVVSLLIGSIALFYGVTKSASGEPGEPGERGEKGERGERVIKYDSGYIDITSDFYFISNGVSPEKLSVATSRFIQRRDGTAEITVYLDMYFDEDPYVVEIIGGVPLSKILPSDVSIEESTEIKSHHWTGLHSNAESLPINLDKHLRVKYSGIIFPDTVRGANVACSTVIGVTIV